jgi:hypothetical protein
MVDQKTIDEILDALQLSQREVLQSLRSLVKRTVPETVELVKKGRVVYKLGAKDFVWISLFQSHVDLEFAMGASLSSDLLKSRGVSQRDENVRHVEVSDFKKSERELSRLLAKAATIGFEHCSTK